jgi:hypothetical protein
LSIRQNNGPAGNRSTFFSATGLISNFCADAVDGSNKGTAVAASQQDNTINLLHGYAPG